MTTYLRTHTLRGDIRRMVRWIDNNTIYICMALISLILFVFFRAVAVHERILRGVYPWAIGGEALVPALPWLVRWIWDTMRNVFGFKGEQS